MSVRCPPQDKEADERRSELTFADLASVCLPENIASSAPEAPSTGGQVEESGIVTGRSVSRDQYGVCDSACMLTSCDPLWKVGKYT